MAYRLNEEFDRQGLVDEIERRIEALETRIRHVQLKAELRARQNELKALLTWVVNAAEER